MLLLLVTSAPAPGATTHVSVVAGKPSEFRFTLSRTSVPIGTAIFSVANHGTIPHDFKVCTRPLAGSAPNACTGTGTTTIAPGGTAQLRVSFRRAGRYAYLCTLPGHAAAGMKGILTVRGAPAPALAVALSASGHRPKVGSRWRYTVRASVSGRAVAARLTVVIVDPTGATHPVQRGTSKRNVTNWPFHGTFSDFVVWPASARGVPLELRVVVKAAGKTKTISYRVTPRS